MRYAGGRFAGRKYALADLLTQPDRANKCAAWQTRPVSPTLPRRETPAMSTSQRVWLIVLLGIFGGLALQQLTDFDTTASVVIGVVCVLAITLLSYSLLRPKNASSTDS